MNRPVEERGRASERRYKRYAEYKDSGVEWLGEVPVGWEIKRLRHVVGRIEQGWSPDCENREANEDEWGILKAGCVNGGVFIESEHKALPSDLEAIPELEIRAGDLLMSRASGSRELVGSVAVVPRCRPRLLLCDKVFRLQVAAESANQQFIARALNSRPARWQIEIAISGGSGLASNIPQDVVKNLIVPLPALTDQCAIGAFLDRETAKIDALVGKNELLIGRLQEKRTALITHAVTKGLDPTVPMKDSGVEWLGEIPAHWEVKPLKRGVHFLEGPGIMAADFITDGIPLLRIAGIGGRTATLDGCNFLSPDLVRQKWQHFRLQQGDLLISGSASTGFCCEVGAEAAGAVPYTGIIIIRPRLQTTEKAFLHWFFLSAAFVTQTELARSGSAIQHFGPSHLSRMHMMLPPLSEQLAIASLVDRETAKIEGLIVKVRDAIDRLKEYRTALISAAVTGKIDVRDELPP